MVMVYNSSQLELLINYSEITLYQLQVTLIDKTSHEGVTSSSQGARAARVQKTHKYHALSGPSHAGMG